MKPDLELEERWESDYRAGKKLALLMAIDLCRIGRREWAKWMSIAVREVLETAIKAGREGDIPALLFGPETTRKQRDAIDAERLLQCYEKLEEMKRSHQLFALDDGDANLWNILAEFVAEFFNRADGASVSTLQKQIRNARKNRCQIPEHTALGYILPLLEFLSRKGYWRARPAKIS